MRYATAISAAVLTAAITAQVDAADETSDQVFIAAVRDADLLLRHLASAEVLAEEWSASEGADLRSALIPPGRFRRTLQR